MIVKRLKAQSFLDYLNERPPYLKYVLTVFAVSIAAIATFYIPVLSQRAAFLLFFFAIIQATFWFGRNPGIFAMILSFIAVNTLVLHPTWISAPHDVLILNTGFFILSAVLITTISLHHSLTAALLENRHDLNHAQAIGQTGSWRMNIQSNELRWSDENHSIFDIPKGVPLTYESFLSTIHPDDLEYVDRKWKAALRGEPYDIEHRIIVTGKVKWVRETAALEFDKNGKLLGGFGTTQDITERKLAEEALREREHELRLIMDATPALMSYLDTDFRYKRVNKTYRDWFCIPEEEVIGKEAREIIGEQAWNIVQPYLEQARSGMRVSFDYHIPYGTGAPRRVHGIYIPDKDSTGVVKGIVVHVLDIEDRKKSELERQKFVSLADNSHEFIGMCDMNFKPFYVNEAGLRLVGLDSLEQACQTHVQEFFSPKTSALSLKSFFRA